MGPILFLIPLQVLYIRRGKKAFAAGAVLSLLLILVAGLLLARRWTTADPAAAGGGLSPAAPFLILDVAVSALLIGGLTLIQLPEMSPELQAPRYPRVTRLVIATVIAGLLSVPLLLYLRGNEPFVTGVQEFIGARIEVMNSAIAASQSAAGTAGVQPLQTAALLELINSILLRSYLFYYFLVLAFSWWLGTIIGARSVGRRPGLTRIADFKLPDRYLWPLIATLALVVLTLIVPSEMLAVPAWNALLILVFLYGISGLAVIRFLLKKLNVRPGVRWMLIAAIIILAMTPRIGFAILILVPGLGVSEVWLKYRSKERSNV